MSRGWSRCASWISKDRLAYSTDSAEVNHVLDKTAEACYGCHTQSQPLARLNRPDRFRIYRNGGGQRVLGIITPIENQARAAPTPPATRIRRSQQVLGVLDTDLSLAKADAQLAPAAPTCCITRPGRCC